MIMIIPTDTPRMGPWKQASFAVTPDFRGQAAGPAAQRPTSQIPPERTENTLQLMSVIALSWEMLLCNGSALL